MTHFRNRNDLLNWLSEHAPDKIVRRALDRGTTTIWGLFKGGFIVEVKYLSRQYIIGIKASQTLGEYCCGLLKRIPFENYKGGSTLLTAGDYPVLVLENKSKARRSRLNQTGQNLNC